MSVLDSTILAVIDRDDPMHTGLTFTALRVRLNKAHVIRADSTIERRLSALCNRGELQRIERPVREGTQAAWRLPR